MADFDKSCVDVAELDEAEIRRVCAALGLGEFLSSQKLTNGGARATPPRQLRRPAQYPALYTDGVTT